MLCRAHRLDGSNIGIRLAEGLPFVEVLCIDLLSGDVYGQFFTAEDTSSIERAARNLFEIIPLEERRTLSFLSRLVGVSPLDSRSLTLEYDSEGFVVFLRVVADALPATFLLHVPHSISGPIAWPSGITSSSPTPPPAPTHDYRYFSAGCSPDDEVGSLVYAQGVTPSNLPSVRTASAFDEAKQPAIGVLVAKTSPTSCTVQSIGQCPLGTAESPLSVGEKYFLGGNGKVVTSPPLASESRFGYSFVQAVGIAVTPLKLELRLDLSTVRTNG